MKSICKGMKSAQVPLAISLVCASLLLAGQAEAFDLNGAWASDADNCGRVFGRKGGRVDFNEMSDVYGGGFIVDGDQIAGKYARCRIKLRKDNGQNVALIAACATDIMLQNVHFSLKQIDSNTVARLLPDMDGMEIKYFRCQVQAGGLTAGGLIYVNGTVFSCGPYCLER